MSTIDHDALARSLASSDLDDAGKIAVAGYVRALTRENEALRRLHEVDKRLKRLDELPSGRGAALARVERLSKHAARVRTPEAERRVRVGVAKGIAAGALDRDDVYEAMRSVAKIAAGDRAWAADEVSAFTSWLDSPAGAGWQVLYEEAAPPSLPEPVDKRADEPAQDPISKRAARRFPDLDEPEAVTAYLDTPEGQQHHGRILDR